MKNRIVCLIVLIFVFSCTNRAKPEKVLADYVSYRFSEKKQTKEKLLQWLEGPLKLQMEAIPDDKIASFNSDGRFKLTGFKVIKSRCTEQKCFATYTVKYLTFVEGQKDKKVESEIKELAELVSTESGWKLSDVKNIKTYHDSKAPVPIYGQ